MKKTEKNWGGYTQHELNMRRAVNAVRLEIAKENLLQKMQGSGESSAGKIGGFLINNPAILLRTLTTATTVYSIYRRLFGRRR